MDYKYTKTSSTADWQEKFDKKFGTNGYLCQYNSDFNNYTSCNEEVKSFITNLLNKRDKELVRKIEKRILRWNAMSDRFALARTDELEKIINLIQEGEES